MNKLTHSVLNTDQLIHTVLNTGQRKVEEKSEINWSAQIDI